MHAAPDKQTERNPPAAGLATRSAAQSPGPAAPGQRVQRAMGNARVQRALADPPRTRDEDKAAGRGLTPEEAALLAALPLVPVIPAVLLLHLNPPLLRAFLERLPVEMIARAVGQLPLPLIRPMLGPVVIHLDPIRTREVARGLGADNLRDLIAAPETRAALEFAMHRLLDRVWPEGIGFALDASVGLTFGIPIYAGMSYMTYLWHSSSGVFKFMRRVEGKLALDVGVGAGGYVGEKTKPGGKGGPGAGATIAANAEVGGKLAMLQDFEFRIFEDSALLSLMVAAAGADLRQVESLGVRLLESVHGLKLDPMHFNTRTRVDAALYAQLAAEASAGARISPGAGKGAAGAGAPGGAPGGATSGGAGGSPAGSPDKRMTATGKAWHEQQGAPDLGSPPRADLGRILGGGGVKWTDLLSLLNASLGGRIFGQVGLAVEMRPRQAAGTRPNAGVGALDAEQLEVDVMAEASAAAELTARIPSLRKVVPEVALENGGGLKLSYVLTRGVPLDRAIRLEGYSIYHKRGELDYYAGVAEETELKFRAGPGEGYFPDMPSSLSELVGKVGELRVRRRVHLGMFRGTIDKWLRTRDYAQAEKRQQGVRTMLKDKYHAWGLTSEGFVTVTLVLTRDDLAAVLEMLRRTVEELVGGPAPWRDLFYDVWYFLATGRAPLYVRRAAEQIAGLIKLSEFVLHEQAGVVGAGGLAVGAGTAKVRGHGRGAAIAFYDSDNIVGSMALSPVDIVRILMSGSP